MRITIVLMAAMGIGALPSTAAAAGPSCDSAISAAKDRMQTDTSAARQFAESAERCANGIVDPRERVNTMLTAKWLQGEAFLRVNDIDHAAPIIFAAKKIAADQGGTTKLQGDILLSSGGIHQDRGESAIALNEYQRAHDIFGRIGDLRSQAVSLLNIAVLYYEAKDYQSMAKYLDQSRETYSADQSLLVSVYNNRGLAFHETGRFREAEEQYRKALDSASQMNSPLLRVRILGNIARARLKAGNVAGADVIIHQGYLLTTTGEAAVWRTQFLGLAAQAALQQFDYARAATLIGERFQGVDLDTTTLTFREAHETAYQAYRAVGDTEHALAHLAALKRLDDKATALATSSNTALMAARFDFANQALRIAKLQAEDLRRRVGFQRASAKTQRTMFHVVAGSGAIVIGLLVFALVTSRRSRRTVDAANADLAVTNESLARALAAKTEFLATTSHEIRTPLNGILGMTQVMLADRGLSPDLKDRIGVIHGAGSTMRALVDDILDVAKMETGRLTLERTAFDLRDTIAGAARLWRDHAQAKGIGFAIDLADCPSTIEGDPARVRQVVSNLLSNAMKFTATGGIRLRAAVGADDTYLVSVADSGIGIAADQQEAIFESFRQADAGTTRRFGGTGLGLSICRNLARAMGGDIAVTSRAGEGATFTVTLPLVRALPSAAAETDPDPIGGPVLLIVDRNPIARSMFRTLIEPHVGAVQCSASFAEGIERIGQGGIAQVLIDEATVRDAGDPVTMMQAIGEAAAAQGTVLTLLWSEGDDDLRASLGAIAMVCIITKPISGSALTAAMFGEKSARASRGTVVSRAA